MACVFSVGAQLVALLREAYEHLGIGVLLEEVIIAGGLGEFIVLSYSLCFVHVATCDF